MEADHVLPWLRRRKRFTFLLLCLFCFCTTPGFATLEQGAVLQEVKTSGWITTGRPTWVEGTDPCSSVSVWEGIDCDISGNVITLNLTRAGVMGPIPVALGRLTSLVQLDMGNDKYCKVDCGVWNRVTGDLAPLATLVNLQLLVLTSNELSLPSFPTAIYELKKLVNLRVDNTQIKGEFPVQLSTLPNLQLLYLGNNSFTGTIPKDIWGSMINLKELTFWGNQLTGLIPPELGNLVNLTYLNFHTNLNLYGGLPPELGKLTNLQRLYLQKNKFTGPLPEAWRGMTSLQRLTLGANSLFGTLPAWLLQLPEFSLLELSNNLFRGTTIPVLNVTTVPALQSLLLDCNYFEGSRPKVLKNMTANLDNNCWENETLLDSACALRPQNCLNFLLYTNNGKCPGCPSGQYMVNTTTCVCHAVSGSDNSKAKIGTGAIVGIVVGIMFGLALLVGCLWWRFRKPGKNNQQGSLLTPDYFQTNTEGGSMRMGTMPSAWEIPRGVQQFTIEELMAATKGFEKGNEIGEGGFGKVFVGKFPDGRILAIKRAGPAHYSSTSGHEQFKNEVLLLSRLHHKNLVRLEGFCNDRGQQILVYEYMKQGNLDSHLHGIGFQGKYMVLDWYKRLEIALNVAQGLDYLHSFAEPPVIHRDVKPSNILLDDNLIAKVADFGISKESPEIQTHVSTRAAGTAGYFDPQYFLRRQLTTASDVYSFGVVLLELISGRKAIELDRLEEETNIIEWTLGKVNEDHVELERIVDSKLEGNYPRETYLAMVNLGLKCASFKRHDRPTMKAVVNILEPLLQAAERPPPNTSHLLPFQSPTSSKANTTEGPSTPGYSFTDEGTFRPSQVGSHTRVELDTVLLPR